MIILGIIFLVVLVGLVFFGIDVFLYRWIRKQESTTPLASHESLEIGHLYSAELRKLYDDVKAELAEAGLQRPVQDESSKKQASFIGRAVWVDMDGDHSSITFKPRKGTVTWVFKNPPSSCKEAMVVEFTSPPLTLFLFPRRIRHVIVEYYQKWDNIHRTFEGFPSYVRVLRLKNRAVIRSDAYARGDASAIGCALISSWPVPSSEERLLEKYAKGEGMGER